METQQPNAGKFAMNYGLILGLVMIFIAVISYVTGMDLEGKQWPQYLYYLLFPIVIFYAISKFKKKNANVLSVGQGIKIGLVIGAVSGIVFVIYNLIFNYVIDPEHMGKITDVVRDRLLESPNMTEEMVDQQMGFIEKMMNPITGSAFWIAASLIFALIYSLIGGLIMKKESGV